MQDKVFIELKKRLPYVQRGVLLKNHTTYKIGGPARYFFVAKTKEDLIRSVGAAKELKLPVFVLGGGSNLLISDQGIKAFVIKIQNEEAKVHGNMIYAGAGLLLPKLSHLAQKNDFIGLEWASGIPGTVGGAIYGHAQAFGSRISEAVKEVEILDLKTLKIRTLSKKQCNFSLKNSIFKKNKNLFIISAVLKFEKGDAKEIKEKIHKFLAYRRNGHPLSYPSAGSMFVNPEKKITDRKLLSRFPALKEFNKRGVIPSGYLIEEAGLMGKKIGKAQISEKHANFIVNLGGAKSKDILALVKLAKQKVKKIFGISLQTEVQFAGFDNRDKIN